MELKKVIYIAGPVTGVEKYWEPFEKAKDALESLGFIALSPTWQPQGMTNQQYMRMCLTMIDCADAVLLLPGWENSEGAILERDYCKYTGKPYGHSPRYLKEVLK